MMDRAIQLNIRNKALDIIRGLAIAFVVLGHTIQCTHGEPQELGLFYSNPVFSLIYSFHMPLFMLVAGYLFFQSAEKYDTKTLIVRRIKTTVIPILAWATINEIYSVFIAGERFLPVGYLLRIAGVLWFLWALFLSTLLTIIGKRIFKDCVIFHIIILAAFVLLPDVLDKYLYGFMYPYYIIGYYFNKHKNKLKLDIHSNKLLIALLAVYSVLMIFWTRDSFIYTTYLSVYKSPDVLKTLLIDLYRWTVGLTGSCCVILTIHKVCQKTGDNKLSNIFAYLGRQSLGLYILNAYITNYILLNITFFANWNIVVYTLICIPLSAAELLAAVALIKIIQRFRLLNLLLLGGK